MTPPGSGCSPLYLFAEHGGQHLIHRRVAVRKQHRAFPAQERSQRVEPTVSATWLFHTILNEVGLQHIDLSYAPPVNTELMSLRHIGEHPRPVLSESFAPDNMLLTMEKLTPDLVDRFNSRVCHRSYITDPYKLLQIDGVEDKFFNLHTDPFEMKDLSDTDSEFTEVQAGLHALLENAVARRPANLGQSTVELTSDQVTQRLRGLGYLD